MCLRSIMESHGKVMEFHMKATVEVMFMFDMSLFLSPLRLGAMWAPDPALPPPICTLELSSPGFFPSFGLTLMFSVVCLAIIPLTLF